MKVHTFLPSLFSVAIIVSARLEEQIYLRVADVLEHCYSMLNGTHQVGCQSDAGGNSGVVVYYDDQSAVERIETKFDSSLKLVVAIDLEFFNAESLKFLSKDKVNGVLLLIDNKTLLSDEALSEDGVCPNKEYDFYGPTCDKKWNSDGAMLSQGLRFINWNKPLFMIRNETVKKIIKEDCYMAFNANGSISGSSLCSARLGVRMNAAGNAEICLRRNEHSFALTEMPREYCVLLVDNNVISVIPPPAISRPKTKLMVIASRMDSFSLFANEALGDVSVLTSVMSVIAVAEAIGKNMKEFEKIANVTHHSLMFAFFHGETYGSIGSSRAVYDMFQKVFPAKIEAAKPDMHLITLDDIETFLEVQLIFGSSKFFAHVDGKRYFLKEKKTVNELISAANKKLLEDGINASLSFVSDFTRDSQIPPSSFQAFMKKTEDIDGFVMGPFDSRYSYKKVNSFADRIKPEDRNETINHIVAAATATLGAVLRYVYGDLKRDAKFQINKYFVEQLYDCFITSPDWQTCSMFKQILEMEKALEELTDSEKKAKQTSIGVDRQHSLIRLLVKALMVYSLGSKDLVNVSTRDQCDDLNKNGKLYMHTWQRDPDSNSTFCYRSPIYLTAARSPAFDIVGYDFKSGLYSTWVESQWDFPKLVFFLTPPNQTKFDLAVLGAGCSLFIISCIFVEIVYLSSKQFFDPPAPSPEADKTAAPL